MNLKIVSVLLLALFCIVIAFPGYGSSARVSKKQTIIFADQSDSNFPGLALILKKCLSKGVNMIEEERSTEEDEAGSAVVFECMSFQFSDRIATILAKLDPYQPPYYQTASLTIFTPPDCFFN